MSGLEGAWKFSYPPFLIFFHLWEFRLREGDFLPKAYNWMVTELKLLLCRSHGSQGRMALLNFVP